MRGAILYWRRHVLFEERDTPKIIKPTDAIIRISATSGDGSDLWAYRGANPVAPPTPMGHEYCGILEEDAVFLVKSSQFVVGSFFASDNTCAHFQVGYQTSCQQREVVTGAQAPILRVPLADGTLVATSEVPSKDLIPSLLTLSDVMSTGWFPADGEREARIDGCGHRGRRRRPPWRALRQADGRRTNYSVIHHKSREDLAREFGATCIVAERGDDAVARIREMTMGVGADSVLECTGRRESIIQGIRTTRPGGSMAYVGVPHGVELDGERMFFAHVHLHGGPAPVRRYLPQLIGLVCQKKINPGKVFDLTLPVDQVAEAYRAIDEHRAIKALLRP